MISRIPPMTQALMIACAVMYLLQQFLPIDSWLALWPLGTGFMPWQLLSYGFLHGSFTHLLFNLLALYMFGAPLELTWGEKRFAQYFLVCVVGAGLIQLLVGWWVTSTGGLPYPTVGASGGIFGLLLAYGMLFPHQRIMLLIPPIPMKARTFVIVYGVIELFMGLGGFQPGVAHFAHLGGMLFGWLMIRYWRGQPPFGGGRGKGRKGPRLVR